MKNPKIAELMNEGKWFWSNDFIKPHVNPLLIELEKTYSVVLETIENSNEQEIIADLMAAKISNALLLKHIMVLLDTSAETLDRAAMYIKHKGLTQLTLPDRVIPFSVLTSQKSGLSNNNIYKAGNKLTADILALLCYASESIEFYNFDTFKNCRLSKLAGDSEKLKQHLYYLSLRSSTQIKQIRAVDFGAQLEAYINLFLEPVLLELGVSKTRRYKEQQFDLVLYKDDKHIIIEIAFQETTNSTLERKSKQAKNGLYKMINDNDDRLVYIVDGAGYFKRSNALHDLINYSNFSCTVSEVGLNRLREYVTSYFK